MSSDYIYFICYPGGDRTKLKVCYESHACSYEIDDYDLASREQWSDSNPAIEYCKQLAKKHNLTYIQFEDEDGHAYLD